jgi:hypothetical protein
VTSASTPIQGCSYDPEDQKATPIAPPGTLCVFTSTTDNTLGTFSFPAPVKGAEHGDSPAGTFVWFEPVEAEPLIGFVKAWGPWAVTAP